MGEDEPTAPRSAKEARQLERAARRMRRLKPDLYAVYKRFLDHGMYHGFYADTAHELNIAESTVRYRLSKAMEWVRDQLKSEDLS